MSRVVADEIIRDEIRKREPMGLEKLALTVGIPALSLSRIIAGHVPKSVTQGRLAEACGVPINTLFPIVESQSA